MKSFKNIVALSLIGICLSSSAFAGKGDEIPHDPWSVIGSFLEVREAVQLTRVNQASNAGAINSPLMIAKMNLLATWPGFARFEEEFVRIPKGLLPDGTEVASFQAARFPVTRGLWNEIMGGIPTDVPASEQGAWNSCLTCPVTNVNWENEDGSPAEVQTFLATLNARTEGTGCTYDLPTDSQLHYLIRGDMTGANTDLYSAGVTAANVDSYVTHSRNSGGRLQPVGNKTVNAFGMELGNVWKMSKDLENPARPTWGRSVRGGSWYGDVDLAESGIRFSALAGKRFDSMGFSLVRTCN